jgi:hypothetical protein
LKFFVYGVAGLTIPVEADPGVPFSFSCSEEECGKTVEMEGEILRVSEEEFSQVLENLLENNPSFSKISEIREREYLFTGKVNGSKVKLPAESFEAFSRRFIDEVVVLQ